MAEKLTIFISGTMRDLPTERERVAAAIRDMGLDPVWAEKRGATDRPSRGECERMARTCHVYLGLYSLSYGWKFPPEETISATEFEWQTARRAGKPMLIYRQKGQPELEQAAFLKRVGDWQKGRFWYEFETLDDLLPRLLDDLARLIAESFRPERPVDLADYRAHLRRLYADLPLSGIPVPLDVTLPLDRVYIKLRALPEQEEAARREAALPADRDEELPHKLAEYLWQQRKREELEEAALRLEGAQLISPEEAIAQYDRLAILGKAGAGKSTLLRHLAWERAGGPEAPLPLLVPLGRADALISQTGCSFLEAALHILTEHKVDEEREALKQALASAIEDKNVLFLCDGLDEAHLARRSLVDGLEKLAADGQRLVVTSRPLGYERLAALEHFHVLSLLPEDARAFSDCWFRALAQARGVPASEREGWAAERASCLQRQLDERPGLREVARNPLLLTFLAVLAGDEPQRDLPTRRKELYREYVERLFTVWEARRRREGELSLGRLRGEEARRGALWGLYRTAWHLHRAYYGDDAGPRAVRGETEPLLARDLMGQWEFSALQAGTLAAEVLHFWEGAGLLDVYRLAGQEWLAFRYLTFQEYGTARALAKAYENDASGLWRCLSPYLLCPQWTGVIPLTLACLPEVQATNLGKRLLKANKKDKDRQRPLFVVAIALAEGAEVTDARRWQVVDALLRLARTRSWESKIAVSALGRLVGDGYAAARLLALAQDRTVDNWVRMEAAEALGRLGRTEEATELLLVLARDQEMGAWVRMEAAEALGRLGRAEEATELLLALARDQEMGAWVQKRATEALGELDRAGEAAGAWLTLAQDRAVDDWVRMEAAEALGRLGRAEEATELLLALARDQEMGAWVRKQAAEALGEMGRAGEAAEAWLALAQDRAIVGWVRMKAAEALERLGRAEEAAELFLALAWDQEMGAAWVRMEAAVAVGRLGQTTAEMLAGLRALAEEPGTPESVRRAAKWALEQLERESPKR
jgi:predicted Zn-dependent protease